MFDGLRRRAAWWIAPRADRDPLSDYWYGPLPGTSTASGASVTTESAMRLSAVSACVRLISGTVAKVPLPIYRRISEDGRERARAHPLTDLLNLAPNESSDAFEWRRTMTADVALSGQALSLKKPGARGLTDALVYVPSGLWRVQRLTSGDLVYWVRESTGTAEKLYTSDQVFHLRDLTLDGINGLSRIAQAREGIGLGIAAEVYAANFFGNGATPGFMLTTDKELSGPRLKEIHAALRERVGGYLNAHKPFVAHSGLKPVTAVISNKDSQFLETRNFQIEDIARIYGVPPHLIGLTEKQTSWGTGVEQMSLGFLAFYMLDWFVMWESAIRRQLIEAPGLYFAEHVVDGLLRADFKTRIDGYARAIETGLLNPDEARQRENLNPRPDGLGGRYLKPANTTYADETEVEPEVEPEVESDGAAGRVPAIPKNGGGAVIAREVSA